MDAAGASVRGLVNRGTTLIEMRRYDDALFDMNLAVQLDTAADSVDGLLGRALANWRARDFAASANDLRLALQKRPADMGLYWRCGNALIRAGLYDDAVAVFEAGLRQDRYNPGMYAGIGEARRQQRDYDAAIAQASRAITLDRSDLNPVLTRAIAYTNQASLTDALDDLGYALSRPGTGSMGGTVIDRVDAYRCHEARVGDGRMDPADSGRDQRPLREVRRRPGRRQQSCRHLPRPGQCLVRSGGDPFTAAPPGPGQ